MKIICIVLSIVILSITSCNHSETYKIKGYAKGMNDSKVYLGTKKNGKQYEINPLDSTCVKDGQFEFTGSVDIPVMRYIKIENYFGLIPVFLENSKISVKTSKMNYPEATISGSEIHHEYQKLLEKESFYEDSIARMENALKRAYRRHDHDTAIIQKQLMNLVEDKRQYKKDFLLSDAPSVLRLYALKYAKFLFSTSFLDSVYRSLDTALYQTETARDLKKRIYYMKQVKPGKPYINLILPDTSGKELPLSRFVGKDYVLLYFVSTSPQSSIMPKGFKHLYEEYHRKGIEFYGVYLGSDQNYFRKRVKHYQIEWPFVMDKYNNKESVVYNRYGYINTLFYYLIDEKGNYIGKYQSVKEIETKFEAIFR